MADRCKTCGAPISVAAFPGALVRCVCGAEVVVSEAGGDPYRSAQKVVAPLAALTALRPDVSESVSTRCPRCEIPLSESTGTLSFLECGACGGAFLSHITLKALLNAGPTATSRPPDQQNEDPGPVREKYAPCPECREIMSRKNFGQRSGVVVDICRAHGTWFDTAELARVLKFSWERSSSNADASHERRLAEAYSAMPLSAPLPTAASFFEALLYFLIGS